MKTVEISKQYWKTYRFSDCSLRTLLPVFDKIIYSFRGASSEENRSPRRDKRAEESVKLYASQMLAQTRNQFCESMWANTRRERV